MSLRTAAALLLVACPAAQAATPLCALAAGAGVQAEQRIPRQGPARFGALLGEVLDQQGRGVPGAQVKLETAGHTPHALQAGADGTFRFRDLPPGDYRLAVEAAGFHAVAMPVTIAAGEMAGVVVVLIAIPAPPPPEEPLPEPPAPLSDLPRVTSEIPPHLVPPAPGAVVGALPAPDRWRLDLPDWERHPGVRGEFSYRRTQWWNPFDRNVWKGDKPILGQRTFFLFNGTSDTFFDARRLPLPSNVSAARPGSEEFFGRGEQGFLFQTFRLTFELFRGDTAFRPADYRIRVTPAFNINYLNTRELGVVNIDVRAGTNRRDAHIGLQEAFLEVKLADLSVNYDFIAIRAGIQRFNSDFRGLLLVEEQPGVRVFGTLRSNRLQYNAAYFYFLEKDTNSLLNAFEPRGQQVGVANLYIQDFLRLGYTTQFSYHYNRDHATMHFDHNNFLVRPAPIGTVQPHDIRAHYLGWTGSGHIGRININHAFYQALGTDSFNPIAGRQVDINAQLAAVELSMDRSWLRLRSSFFFASGDSDPRDDRARGFDTIVDFSNFAGGFFSLWSREAIRLTGTGVALTEPNSLLPNLRTLKEEGQANFVNPGIVVFNLGSDIELTTKLRAVLNANYSRFHRTAPLELLLFQAPIRHGIGQDYTLGLQYRPPLSENMVVTGGVSTLVPARGFQDIYTDKTLFSVFTNVRFRF